MGEKRCPDVPGVKCASRWRSYSDDGDTAPFEGDTLLRTDWKLDNILIQVDGTVRVVDWAWPTRGAAWIGPACLLIQLIPNGPRWLKLRPIWLAYTPEGMPRRHRR